MKKKEQPTTKSNLPTWPVLSQLLSWFLFEKMDETWLGDVTPPLIEKWLAEFDEKTRTTNDRVQLHRHLWESYEEFKAVFGPPDTLP